MLLKMLEEKKLILQSINLSIYFKNLNTVDMYQFVACVEQLLTFLNSL